MICNVECFVNVSDTFLVFVTAEHCNSGADLSCSQAPVQGVHAGSGCDESVSGR